MSGPGHCRGHIAAGPVNNLDRDFSPADPHGVQRLQMLLSVITEKLMMTLQHNRACLPSLWVVLAAVYQPHEASPYVLKFLFSADSILLIQSRILVIWTSGN